MVFLAQVYELKFAFNEFMTWPDGAFNSASLVRFFFALVVGRILFDPGLEILIFFGHRMLLAHDTGPRIAHTERAGLLAAGWN